MLIIVSFSVSANLYQQDSLQIELDVESGFDLIAESGSASITETEARFLLFPEEDFRQDVLDINHKGSIEGDNVVFTWKDGKIESKDFRYTASIKTKNVRRPVKNRIAFPLTSVKGFEEYLKPTDSIDSTNPEIVKKAQELVKGEDDLFKAVFKLASWTEENIEYDLTTLTASTSQKASWVLKERRGVCDEMTSLFVAMARSVGVPARFVSGISYTTSDLFNENWQPHGWAEVYFPEIGWVGFDVTFNQYGYVDVTHIKLRDGFDPQDPATKFQWTGKNVKLAPQEIDFDIRLENEGTQNEEQILLEQEILSNNVGFGSYNYVKGIVKNNENYYAATALNIAVPPEIEVIGRNRRNILLGPKEVKETFWVLKIPENLQKRYVYTFPTLIYSEQNKTIRDEFKVERNGEIYSKNDIERVTVSDEDKSYSRKIVFDCEFPDELYKGEQGEFTCDALNKGSIPIRDASYCLNTVCENVDIDIGKGVSTSIKVTAKEIGWQSVVVSIESEEVEKKDALSYRVLDKPTINMQVVAPKSVKLKEHFRIEVLLTKESFQTPKDLLVSINGPSFVQTWDIASLDDNHKINMNLEDFPLSSSNEFIVSVEWKDNTGKQFSQEQIVIVEGESSSFGESVIFFFNKLIGWFS